MPLRWPNQLAASGDTARLGWRRGVSLGYVAGNPRHAQLIQYSRNILVFELDRAVRPANLRHERNQTGPPCPPSPSAQEVSRIPQHYPRHQAVFTRLPPPQAGRRPVLLGPGNPLPKPASPFQRAHQPPWALAPSNRPFSRPPVLKSPKNTKRTHRPRIVRSLILTAPPVPCVDCALTCTRRRV